MPNLHAGSGGEVQGAQASGSLKAAILGAADGACSIGGVIAGGMAAHIPNHALGFTAIAGGLAATVSMAGAEMLSEDTAAWTSVTAMGVGTLLGAALPAAPLLLLAGAAGWIAVACTSVAIGCLVGIVRSRVTRRRPLLSIVQTLAVLGIGGLVGYGAGLLG